MTPPAAAAATRTRTRRAAPPPRRVSGPVRGRAAVATPPPLALRLGGAVHSLAEHRLLDRIIRGRAWIGILAVGLIGIVFMQVSMLRMNAGIGRDVDMASKLERENSAMRATLSELTSGDRIEAEAAKLGFVLPAAGAARFLDARHLDVRRALANIQPPSHLAPLPVGTATTTASGAVATLPATGVAPSPDTTTAAPAAGTTAPATTQTAGTTAPATTTTTAAPTTATAQPASTPPPATTQQTSPPPAGAATAPPATAAAGGTTAPPSTGGAPAGGAG